MNIIVNKDIRVYIIIIIRYTKVIIIDKKH